MTCAVAYVNAWPDALTFDDEVFAVEGRLGGIGLAEIRSYFTEDVWAIVGTESNLYRPLLILSVAVDKQLYGGWAAGMHLTNILLHALATIAVFGLVQFLLLACGTERALSRSSALLAAVIFAVHPIHTEVVNSIFNRSEMLVTLGTAGGLWWFLGSVERKTAIAWLVLSVVYFVVLLCRETGIVLPALTVVCLWLTSQEPWQARLRRCLPVFWLLIPLGAYLLLRANALDAPDVQPGPAGALVGPTQALGANRSLFVGERLLRAAAVWYDSLLLMLWPHPLIAFRGLSDSNAWLALIVQLMLLAFAAFLALRKKPGLLIGLAFFYIAILPASRIVGGLDVLPHVAERYLYMPSAGLAVALAFFLAWLARRVSPRVAALLVLVSAIALTPLTWARNEQWSSTLRLIESDYATGSRSVDTLRVLTMTLIAKGNFARAASVCEENADRVRESWYVAGNCAQVYANLGRLDEAENAFKQVISNASATSDSRSPAHMGLATLYVTQNRMLEAEDQFELAVSTQELPFMKEYLQAEKLIWMYPDDRDRLIEAKAHLEESIRLQPRFYRSRQNLAELEEILNRMEGSPGG